MTASLDTRHRTSDLWEAAFVWAQGYPLIDTERVSEDRIVFCFPDGGEQLRDAIHTYRLGTALVNPVSYRQGYYEMREAMNRELRGDRRA